MNKQAPDFRASPTTPAAFFQGSGETRHPAGDAAEWIWIDNEPKTRFLKFSIEFQATEEQTLRFHITADQRFQLRLDGQDITYGPDRSDLEHWSTTTCEVPLSKGAHRLEALVWWIAEDLSIVRAGSIDTTKLPVNPPMSQVSWRGGFLFAAEGPLADILNTGFGDWKIEDLTESIGMARKTGLGYHDIGPSFTVDMEKWNADRAKTAPVCVLPTDGPNPHGVRRPGWVLREHTLPEQQRALFSGGTFRALRNSFEEHAFTAEDAAAPELAIWNNLKTSPVEIPENIEVTVILDLGEYVCGYPQFGWSGGAGATLEIEWAESLYCCEHSSEGHATTPKGNRSDVLGKSWVGFGDTFRCSGAEKEDGPGIWWRSGAFIRIRIRTANEALRLNRAELLTSIYPLNASDQWTSSDTEWDSLFPLLHRGLELCAHETWLDCPYYEQLMYVGDTRLHCLSNYACYPDDRISRSAIAQFDDSRSGSLEGLVAERYPSGWRQNSPTFALIWVWMVRDFMLWRNDTAFVQQHLIGVRQMLEKFLSMRKPDGLLGLVPGWPFVDWDPQWDEGCGPGVREGDSSIVNLHLILSLQAAAELENAAGEKAMADRWTSIAQEIMTATVSRYWSTDRAIFLDSPSAELTSEHAQALALLTGLLDSDAERTCMGALTAGTCGAKCTIYFSFYLLEAFARAGKSESFFNKLDFWRELPKQGFKSLPESPGNTRSDCHGWGAHPLFHSYASIAGIRPAAPGFQAVRIEPMPGSLENISLTMPHPNGEISFAFKTQDGASHFEISLPEGISGELIWNRKTHPLKNTQTLEF